MDVTQLEEAMNDEPEAAEAALRGLVAQANVEELSHIAQSGRVPQLKVRAIEALGEVGGARASEVLVELLESLNTGAVEGGTEQRMEQERLRGQAVRSLSRVHSVRPPARATQEAIAEFIGECRGR